MSRLIINVDDFGYCSGVNRGIIESHQNGVLTSTTMMCGMPGFDEAVNLAIENPKLGVGVHLTLTSGYPVKKDLQTIVAEDGKFRSSTFYFKENGL